MEEEYVSRDDGYAEALSLERAWCAQGTEAGLVSAGA